VVAAVVLVVAALAVLAPSRLGPSEASARPAPVDPPPRAGANERERLQMLARLAEPTGDPETDFRILDVYEVVLPTSRGAEPPPPITVFEYLDRRDAQIRQIAWDGWSRIDLQKRLALAEEVMRRASGAVSPALAAAMQAPGIDAQTRFPVLVHMDVQPAEFIDRARLGAADPLAEALDMQRMIDLQMRRDLDRLTDGDAALEQLFRADEGTVRIGPFVHARLTAAEIHKIEDQELIRSIDLTDLELSSEDGDGSGVPFAQAFTVTHTDAAHARGATGSGVRIGILEPGAITNTCFTIAASQVPTPIPDEHATNSSAIIGNTHDHATGGCDGEQQGYAPGAVLLLANAGTRDSYDWVTAYQWLKEQAVDVVSVSWQLSDDQTKTTWSARDVILDWAAVNAPYPVIVMSGGKPGGVDPVTGEPFAQVAAWGHNVLSVGDVLLDDDADPTNNVMSSISPTKDPQSLLNDRELPSLAAPGSRHLLLGRSFGGTSAATPVVASIAALVIEQNTYLRVFPEAVRAILQASADAQHADGELWSAAAEFDGADGTGIVNAERAVVIARHAGEATPHAFSYGSMMSTAFVDNFFNQEWTVEVPSDAQSLRVCLAWSSPQPAWSGRPLVNLNLLVYGADDVVEPIGVSTTKDESYEFIEISTAPAGKYLIRVQSFDAPKTDALTHYGIAWTAVGVPLP
jgi:hypothetical protein